MKHQSKQHENNENSTKGGSGITLTLGIVGLLLLAIMIMQLSSVNSNLAELGVKIDSMELQVPTAPTAPTAPKAPTQPTVDFSNLIDDDTVKGDENAPVTIVEWSDFECPFCARFYRDTLGQIDEEYIKTGKVKLVFRDFPLSFHANAQKASEAAECAGEQGKYWEMHDKLFESGVNGGVSTFKGYASDIGLDTAKFNTCLDTGAMADEVAKDMRDGQAAGITGTPGFLINGQKLSGAQPFSSFKRVIDAELAK